MRIELQYIEGCPNWRQVHERLAPLAEARATHVELRRIDSPEEAERLGFRGSPTILVDGRDPFASGEEHVGLACRTYRTPAGPRGAPDDEQLNRALS